MTPVHDSPRDYNLIIGIDVDKKSFTFKAMDLSPMKEFTKNSLNDQIITQRAKKIPANPENFYNYVQNTFPNKKILCAYEAGPTGFHLYDYLTQKSVHCVVIAPTALGKAPNEKIKTNGTDTIKIIDYVLSSKFKSVRVPHGPYRELRSLIETRENYANNRKVAKQRIKALLLSADLYSKLKDPNATWSNNYIKELQHIECTQGVRNRLNMLLMDLDYARHQTLSVHKILKTFCKDHEEIDQYRTYLESIPGIGFIIALTVLARFGNPQNLKNQRELAAFVGLVPTENSTGEKVNKGSITRLGNKTLRFLLIEAAWVAIRHDIQLFQFFNRIRKRHHPSIAKKKAITAVARKITPRIYCVLKEQRKYQAH